MKAKLQRLLNELVINTNGQSEGCIKRQITLLTEKLYDLFNEHARENEEELVIPMRPSWLEGEVVTKINHLWNNSHRIDAIKHMQTMSVYNNMPKLSIKESNDLIHLYCLPPQQSDGKLKDINVKTDEHMYIKPEWLTLNAIAKIRQVYRDYSKEDAYQYVIDEVGRYEKEQMSMEEAKYVVDNYCMIPQ